MVLGALGGTLVGCGGAPDPVPTQSVSPGTVVSPTHYLALVREAVAAARAANIRLAALPNGLTADQARAAAPGLAAAATRAEAAAQQLSAARLEDQRLEDQRKEIAPLDVTLATALRAAADAAKGGDPEGLDAAAQRAARAADAIRAASGPGS